MKIKFLGFLLLIAMSSPLWGDAIPYSKTGSVAPTVTMPAAATGSIIGYFYGADAADIDVIRMIDVTSPQASAWAFNNHATAQGASYTFATSVNKGDVLVFTLWNKTTGATLSSDPSQSTDGLNHAYVTAYSGGSGIPAGIYVGMEDLTRGQGGDFDYNDDMFVFTNVALTPTPEPASLVLLGSGFLCLGGAIRRKFKL
jgi:hypothetical protein